MKAILLLSILISANSFAQIECRPVKTTYHLYKAQDSLLELTKCKTPRCLQKKLLKVEKHYCKAIASCPTLEEKTNSPCLTETTLRPEVKEKIQDKAEEYFKNMLKALIEYVKEL